VKIVVLGTRGIPDIPGGVETHCQSLYPRLVERGCEVVIVTRKPYISDIEVKEYKGIQLKHLFAPRIKSFEAIVHTFLGICYARWASADVVHVHAVGPALLIPFARLLGLKVVMTNHGPDYDRQKWGSVASFILRMGEKVGGKFANEVIVISNVIAEIVRENCNKPSHLIYNGVQIPHISTDTSYIESLSIKSGQYILAVARFVPEKGLHDLVEAFKNIHLDCHLVIAGDSDHEDEYSFKLKETCHKNNNIVLTGYITGDDLHQIFSHAKMFVLPSYHEGLPISLLEALSYGLIPLVSDIPANLEVGLDSKYYFQCGNAVDLSKKLASHSVISFDQQQQENFRNFVREKYNWDDIADQTNCVYQLLN
jgi:glycosyltransferase involved in cell wall biosynthesis